MRFEGREFFSSELNNDTLRNFKIIDYQNDDLEYRKNKVNELLENNKDEFNRNFFEIYYDDFYKVNLNASDSLSEKINVHQTLEYLADYLLNSKEIREDRKSEKTQYYFYMNKEEFKLRTNKELLIQSIQSTNSSGETIDNENIIHYLINKQKNTKLKKSLSITAKDLERTDLTGQVLKEYNVLLDKINFYLKNPEKTTLKRYKITAAKKAVVDDMILAKKQLDGVFGEKPKNLLPDSTEPTWDMFDFKNKEHVKRLIYVQKDLIPNDDLSLLLLDLDLTIDKLYKEKVITNHQYEVIKLIRKGYKNIEICEIKQIKKPRITAIVKTVVFKINEYFKSLEEL